MPRRIVRAHFLLFEPLALFLAKLKSESQWRVQKMSAEPILFCLRFFTSCDFLRPFFLKKGTKESI